MVDVKELLAELHIDDTAEEEATMTDLLGQATAVVNHAIADVDNPNLPKDSLYISAIKSLATQLYYDRTLASGESQGVNALISAVEHKYSGDTDGT
ncbi:head-tail connector protein [Lactobacillus sp. ESL0791]|uniref:head-tail connector protein n=1 Tax=Lactobacillus sp. ESL0791 TaxID=2983234 RepID=UPI0023F6D4D0|nr:head-tail connector protein [Lactobacillus sp. ESL0791]MDF7639958.1 head-tail connector protein [Lactobacillus sp. ESL0791]